MKPRKPRSDSTTAIISAFARPAPELPECVTIRPIDQPFWDAAIKYRDDWQPSELILLAHMVRAQGDESRYSKILDDEGAVLNGKINPLLAVIETLSRRVVTYTRTLQLHARATRGEARDVAKLASVTRIKEGLNDLIPR